MWSTGSSSSLSPGGSASATGSATGYSSVPARQERIPPASVTGQGSPGSASAGSMNSMHMGKLPPVTGKCQ